MMLELGSCAKRAYKSSLDTCNKLHDKIFPFLKSKYNETVQKRVVLQMWRFIQTYLSAAIQYFSGASLYDIMLTQGMGKQSIYESIYSVVNVVHKTNSLSFNVSYVFIVLVF